MLGKIKRIFFIFDIIGIFLFCSLWVIDRLSNYYIHFNTKIDLVFYGILLFYYSLAKSIFGIIIVIIKIIKRNVNIKKINKLLTIPTFILDIYIIIYIFERIVKNYHIGVQMYINSLILMFSFCWLIYWIKDQIINKILIVIYCVLTPFSIYIAYWTVWVIILA
jgi:hypothetical protein